jgi:hypothetical protein
MKDRIEDPAKHLGDRLAVMLARKYALDVQDSPESGGAPTQKGSPDLTLSVQTTDWGIDCRGSCSVLYRSSLDLKDNRDGRVLAAGDCEYSPTDPVIVSSTISGYVVNVAAVQNSLEQAAGECVDFYKTKLFNMYGK